MVENGPWQSCYFENSRKSSHIIIDDNYLLSSLLFNIAGKAAILLLMTIAYSPTCYLSYVYGEAIVGFGKIFMQLLMI